MDKCREEFEKQRYWIGLSNTDYKELLQLEKAIEQAKKVNEGAPIDERK